MPNPQTDPLYLKAKAEIDHSRVYDCDSHQVFNPGSPDADLFCSGHSLLADGRLVVAGGTQYHEKDNKGDPHTGHWSGSRETWLFSIPVDVVMYPGATITVAQRGDNIRLFATGLDGAVWTNWSDSTTPWQTWSLVRPEIKMHPGGTVTAIWDASGNEKLELFCTGTDGAVWTISWEMATNWHTWTLINPKIKMFSGASVTAIWNNHAELELFVTGTDGAIWTIKRESGFDWPVWTLINPKHKMKPGGEITALYSNATHIDLFATGKDGALWTMYRESGADWQSWILVHPEIKMQPGAPVTALWRDSGHLDLFATGMDGAVWSIWWEPNLHWDTWKLIHPNIKMGKGETVAAVWQPLGPAHLDIFVTGTDGAVWTTFTESGQAWKDWQLINPAIKMQPGATISAVWQADNTLHIFGTGTDGAIWTSKKLASGKWNQWRLIHSILGGWSKGGLLNRNNGIGGGRWYPTIITQSDGKAFALCGHPLIGQFAKTADDADPRHNNATPELFHPATNDWHSTQKPLGAEYTHNYAPFYPRLHIMPHTGDIFCVQPLYSKKITYQAGPDPDLVTWVEADIIPPYDIKPIDNSFFYDSKSIAITKDFTGPQALEEFYVNRFFTSQPTSSVLLPLLHEENYHPRVLLTGGVQALMADLSPVAPAQSAWKPTGSRVLLDPITQQPPQRYHANSTLLPTGVVVVTGGLKQDKNMEADGIRDAEIYHPPKNGRAGYWQVGATAHETRGYHSVALLVPDGRIWTAGSEWNPQGLPNLSFEYFEPNYYSVHDRVTITHSPGQLHCRDHFTVDFTPTSHNTSIASVVLMRLGSVTHSFDGDQRHVSIPFNQEGNRIHATAPPDNTVVPPGFYMLWLVDANNNPCKLAKFIKVLLTR